MSKKIKAVYLLASVFNDEVNLIENEVVNMLSNLSLCLLSLDSADEFVLEYKYHIIKISPVLLALVSKNFKWVFQFQLVTYL